MTAFAERLVAWQRMHGRHDLPWQRTRDPYRIWLSEVMLQQTQVATVVPYFERFVAHFPTVAALAAAELDDVMRLWAGLGYYTRARNLHAAARVVVERHGGAFPRDFDEVAALPGIGRSTAGAIIALAHDERHPILDGNCKRVYARHAGIAGWPGDPKIGARLWAVADACTPAGDAAAYTQAVMDLGATLCTRTKPRCIECPVTDDCAARLAGVVALLPTPKPRRALPERAATLLVAESPHGEFLLVRRPPRGVWGGLWCAPMVADGDDASLAAAAYGLDLAGGDELAPVRHAFTHYALEIRPLRIRGDRDATLPAGAAWVAREALDDYGLPAPVKKLLEAIDR